MPLSVLEIAEVATREGPRLVRRLEKCLFATLHERVHEADDAFRLLPPLLVRVEHPARVSSVEQTAVLLVETYVEHGRRKPERHLLRTPPYCRIPERLGCSEHEPARLDVMPI